MLEEKKYFQAAYGIIKDYQQILEISIFEKVEEFLGQGLVGQIKDFKRYNEIGYRGVKDGMSTKRVYERGFLIVGDDNDVINGIVAFITFIHAGKESQAENFYIEENLHAWDTSRIQNELPIKSILGKCEILFLRNVQSDVNILKYIVDTIKGTEAIAHFGQIKDDQSINVSLILPGLLIVHINKPVSLPADILNQFEIINLLPVGEANKSKIKVFDFDTGKLCDTAENVAGKTAEIVSRTLFLDDQKNILYFNEDNKIRLEPQQINLILYMVKGRQPRYTLEEILVEVFKIELTNSYIHPKNSNGFFQRNTTKTRKPGSPIIKADRVIFDTCKSDINKKCKELNIPELIQKDETEKSTYKLTEKITIKS